MDNPQQLDQPTQIDQSSLEALISESGKNLIPESLVTVLTVSFILLNILALLFTIFYIISLIRKWKVQSAVLHMQKDVAEIKQALAQKQPEPAPVAAMPVPEKEDQHLT